MVEQIEQFSKDLTPDDKQSNELKDAISYYLKTKNEVDGSIEKEAIFKQVANEAKLLGRTVGGGALLGGGINMIRATGHEDPNETVGGKLKRIGRAGAHGAVGGAVIGAGVHGIQRGQQWKSGLNAVKTAGIVNALEGAAGHIDQGIMKARAAIQPHISALGQKTMQFAETNPGVVTGTVGAGLGALAMDNYGNSGLAPAAGAATGALLGGHFGPRLLSKLAFQKKANLVTTGLQALGKGIAKAPRVAAGVAGAGIGGTASSLAGGDFSTGAVVGGLGGAAFGKRPLLGAVAGSKPLLGNAVRSGARAEMRAARQATRALPAASNAAPKALEAASSTPVAQEVAGAGQAAMSGEKAVADNMASITNSAPSESYKLVGTPYSPKASTGPVHSYTAPQAAEVVKTEPGFGNRTFNSGTMNILDTGAQPGIQQAFSRTPTNLSTSGFEGVDMKPSLARTLDVNNAYRPTPGSMTGIQPQVASAGTANPITGNTGLVAGNNGRVVDQIAPQSLRMSPRTPTLDPELAKRLAYGFNPYA